MIRYGTVINWTELEKIGLSELIQERKNMKEYKWRDKVTKSNPYLTQIGECCDIDPDNFFFTNDIMYEKPSLRVVKNPPVEQMNKMKNMCKKYGLSEPQLYILPNSSSCYICKYNS